MYVRLGRSYNDGKARSYPQALPRHQMGGVYHRGTHIVELLAAPEGARQIEHASSVGEYRAATADVSRPDLAHHRLIHA
jgi:hypothetical protein